MGRGRLGARRGSQGEGWVVRASIASLGRVVPSRSPELLRLLALEVAVGRALNE
jgi:hypothetical protein